MNCSVHTTQPKPSNEATNHSRPRRGTGADSRSSTATRTFNDADLWAPQFGFCFFFYFYFFCFCNQSQAQTTTSMREKKKTQNKRRNEGLQDNEKHKSKTKQHKAESQGEAQISIMYLKWGHKQQMITTNKIKKASLTQTIPCHYSTYMLLNANNQNEEEGKIYWGERRELQLYYSKSNHTSPHFQKNKTKPQLWI